jgi:hypothetical protein
MLLSIANTTPRNIESVRTNDLLPFGIQPYATTFVDLLEYYYKYLNSEGLPSAEIGAISSLKDIDAVSMKYIDQIEELIGKSIPYSQALNKVELYKIIVKYYNSRGSQDSIHTFFKIFYDQIVSIYYPREHLFDLSGGTGSWVEGEWVYEDHKSFPSDDYKLFDGHYWQNYSYEIRSDLDSSVWYDDYTKFIHPAGLKMFSSIVIELVLRNEWYAPLDYTSEDLNTDYSWLQALIPPHALNPTSIGYHTPKYQPGYLRERILRYIFTYLIDPLQDAALTRLVITKLKSLRGPVNVRDVFVREQYQISEKFIDTLEIGAGVLDKVIGDADETFSNVNDYRQINLSAICVHTHDSTIDYSFYDTEFGAGDGVWDGSSFDEAGGAGLGDWSGSSYENM